MEVPLVALAARMTCWAVGGRRSHPLVSFFASRWAETAGRNASKVCYLVATSFKTLVRPVWSCGTGLGGVGRLVSAHKHNHMRMRLSVWRESGAVVTGGDLTATAWRKAKTSPKLSVMVANVSKLDCLFLPVFVFFFLYLNASLAFVVVVVVAVFAVVFPLIHSLHKELSEDLQELPCV